jgi:hypothetical protein
VCVAGPCRGDRLLAVVVRVIDGGVALVEGDASSDAANGYDVSTAG